jgi:pSer/pThr/pTyr-binding forkhead associated (FHA) protein
MAKLVLSSGGTVVFQCFIGRERLGVGRDPANQIVIEDPSVSREHAAIVAVGNDHILEDLTSANGTVVNGQRMSRRILQHGDVVELGAFHLRYLNPKAAEDELDRTMLIDGIAGARTGLVASGETLEVPRTRATRIKFPRGRAYMLSGPRSGMTIELDRVVARFGKPGRVSAVLVRRPQGYFLAHVEGRRTPRVNGQPAGREARRINAGDVIEVADERFKLVMD